MAVPPRSRLSSAVDRPHPDALILMPCTHLKLDLLHIAAGPSLAGTSLSFRPNSRMAEFRIGRLVAAVSGRTSLVWYDNVADFCRSGLVSQTRAHPDRSQSPDCNTSAENTNFRRKDLNIPPQRSIFWRTALSSHTPFTISAARGSSRRTPPDSRNLLSGLKQTSRGVAPSGIPELWRCCIWPLYESIW